MDKLKITFAFLLLFSFTISGFGQVSLLDPSREIPKRKPLIRGLKSPVDVLISGGTIVTMNEKREIIEDGAVAVSEGEIFLIGKRLDVAKQVTPKRIINATGKVIIPG